VVYLGIRDKLYKTTYGEAATKTDQSGFPVLDEHKTIRVQLT